MKITVHEAFILARGHLPTSVNTELVLFGDDVLNARAIVALSHAEKPGLTLLNLVHLGLAKDYASAKALFEKSERLVKQTKEKENK